MTRVEQTASRQEEQLLNFRRYGFLDVTRHLRCNRSLDFIVTKLQALHKQRHQLLLLQQVQHQHTLLHRVAVQLAQRRYTQRNLLFIHTATPTTG